MRTKEIKQTGFIITGIATINLWGGGKGDIEMNKTFLPYEKTTPKNILRCVNDGGFGCEFIESASIDIYIKYDNGSEEFERTLFVDNKNHSKHFLGWSKLREQNITA